MKKRLKVLISAYACEYGKGSEPEVGWKWSLQMARFHDITVLTRENNRSNIESALAEIPPDQPVPNFIFFDGDKILLAIKKRIKCTRLYYIWWQRSAHKLIGKLCLEQQFDILHHVTIAGFRYITAIWDHGIPTIWGPVGGMESIYWRLLPFRHPKELIAEMGRNFNNLVQSMPTAAFPARAKRSNLTIVSTHETQRCLDIWNIPSLLMPTIGIDLENLPERAYQQDSIARPLRLLFVGQLIWLKGVDLAVEALAASNTNATLHFIGNGPFKSNTERIIKNNRMEERVTFSPRIPRSEVLRSLYDYDVFLFPSLHDSGGFAVLEAMAACMPVICLDVGGPSLSVIEGCGFRVPLGMRKCVISKLADRIKYYSDHRDTVFTHGKNARKHVATTYDWNIKGEQMNEIYLQVESQN